MYVHSLTCFHIMMFYFYLFSALKKKIAKDKVSILLIHSCFKIFTTLKCLVYTCCLLEGASETVPVRDEMPSSLDNIYIFASWSFTSPIFFPLLALFFLTSSSWYAVLFYHSAVTVWLVMLSSCCRTVDSWLLGIDEFPGAFSGLCVILCWEV